MKGFNLATVMGNLTADPELRYTGNKLAVVTVSLAINQSKKVDGAYQEYTTFIPVVIWGKTAENVCSYCKKGATLLVRGRLNTRKYETKTGEKRTATDIVAEEVTFITYGGRGNGEGEQREPAQSQFQNYNRGASQPRQQTSMDSFAMDVSELGGFSDDKKVPF